MRMAVTGANGGFGRTLLAQCRAIPSLQVAALCDLDVGGTLDLMRSLGYPADAMRVCARAGEVTASARAGRIALVSDYRLLADTPHDVLVEATGHPEASVRIALDALQRGAHVAMVTKETDSVVGPCLNRVAQERGVVYTTADGDQPSNLIDLVTWARVLGFDIVAAGKSSEYDYVYDPRAGTLQYMADTQPVPALAAQWQLDDDVPAVLARRADAIRMFPQSATPDYCEMNIVANSTGLEPARPEMSYPLCRITELADVFVPREHGGMLDRTGVVDVFNCLRRSDEASFAGGVFIVVRCTDAAVWQMLKQKGHLVSRCGRYACIYRPYHLMGLESPMTLFSAVLHHRPSGSGAQRCVAVMTARTTRAFRAGETLVMSGHQHHIDGTSPRLERAHDAAGKAPYYLAAGKRLACDVPAQTDISMEMLDLSQSELYGAWKTMRI